MKKFKFVWLILAFSVFAISIMSCKNNTVDGDKNNSDTVDDNVIYSPYVSTTLVLGKGIDETDVRAIRTTYNEKTGQTIKLSLDTSSASHEIIIGKTNRELSAKAYNLLSKFKADGEVGYVIYSDGKSVAIAFDEAVYGSDICFKEAVDAFISDYMNFATLKLNAGAVKAESFDAVTRQAKRDEAELERLWNFKLSQLTEKTEDDSKAKYILSELKALYSIYNNDYETVKWLANLYDPVTGGFYYSNSARNNIGYSADLESTSQALGIVESILSGYSGTLADFFGEEVAGKFVSFVKNMQDENGYFYHPQWSREAIDKNRERSNIDVLAALNILESFNATPTYNTPNGVEGDGIVTPVSRLVQPLRNSRLATVSAITRSADDDIYIPARLTSSTAFNDYLGTLSIISKTANACETILADIPLYKAVDEILEQNGEDYRICEILMRFLERNQNSDGLWASRGNSSYEEIAEINSVVRIYNALGKTVPNYSVILSTLLDSISFEEKIDSITDISGVWTAAAAVANNIITYQAPGQSYEVKSSLQNFYLRYGGILAVTREKLKIFLNEDGSFSSTPEGSAYEAYGMSVALPMVKEGDINGTLLAAKKIWLSIFQVLDIGFVPIFDTSDRMMFQKTLLDMGVIIKNEIKKSEPIDFENYDVGTSPVARHLYGNTGGYSTIVAGPNGDDRVAKLYSPKNDAIEFHFDVENSAKGASCFVAEFDMCILPETSTGLFAYINMYRDTYMLGFERVGDTVKITERSSRSTDSSYIKDFGIRAAVGEWFHLRFEYYPGTRDSVRIKIYFGSNSEESKCIAVTDTFFGAQNEIRVPSVDYESFSITPYSSREASMLIDNLIVESNYQTYIPESSSSFVYNIDTPDKSQTMYDFEDAEDGSKPAEFKVSGEASAIGVQTLTLDDQDNKVLAFSEAGGELFLPLDQRGVGVNAALIEFDLIVDANSKAGTKYQINFNEYLNTEKSFAAMQLLVLEDRGSKYIALAEVAAGTVGKPYSDVRLSPGVKYRLRFELFFNENVLVVSVDGVVVGISTNVLENCKRLYMGETTIEALTPTLTSTIFIDNVVSERVKSDFIQATSPDIDRNIYDFETSDGPTFSGVSPSGGALSFENAFGEESYVEIPVNPRVNVSNLAFIGLDITKVGSKGNLVIFLTDKSGNKIAAFDIVSKADSVEIYEYTENGRYKAPIHTVNSPSFNLSIEYGFDAESFNILVDGEYVAASSLVYKKGSTSYRFERLRISSLGGSADIAIDNLYAEQITGIFMAHNVSMPNIDATKEVIDFETSSFASLPSNIEFSKGAPSTYFRIGESTVRGQVSKVFEFYAGYGEGANSAEFSRTQTLTDANAAFFESDLMLESTSDGSVQYNLNFRTSQGGRTVYAFAIVLDSATKKLRARGAGKTDFDVDIGVNENEWFHIRLEYTDTPYDYNYDGYPDMIFKAYVNGELIGEGKTPYYALSESNPTLPSASSLNKINTYVTDHREAKVYMDNVVLGQCNMKYEEPYPADTHTVTYEPGVITNKTQFTFGKNTSTAVISEMTDITGAVGKVLKFHSAKSSSDTLSVMPTVELDTANAISFETDIMINPESDTATIYLEPRNKYGNRSFRLIIEATKGGDVTVSANGLEKKTIGKSGEWIHLKVEYMNPGLDYDGDALRDILYKVYVGAGEESRLAATGYKPYNSSSYFDPLDVTKCALNVTDTSVCDIFLDNTRFWQVERVADEAPEFEDTDEGALGGTSGGGSSGGGWT